MGFPPLFARLVAMTTLVLVSQALYANAQCEEYVHVNSSLTEQGDCYCDVSSSVSQSCGAGVSSEQFQQTILDLDQQISEITTEINALHATLLQQGQDIADMNQEMSAIQATKQRIIDSEIVIGRPEYDIIRDDLQDMEDLIDNLENQGADQAIIDELRAEIANITTNLDSLETNNDADIESLLRDIDGLERKLAECEASKEKEDDPFPYPWDDFELRDSCGALLSLSEPYTVAGNLYSMGVWIMDPLVDVERPWYQVNVNSATSIYRYTSIEQFQMGGLKETIFPGYSMEGCSVVAYNGALFFNKYNSPTMMRYDYHTQSLTNQRTLPDAGYISNYRYLYLGYSSIDFAVDESGLWVIYGSVSGGGILTLSKINELTLEVEQTYQTNYLKTNFGECFMVCGRLYCTDSYNKHDGKIVLMYDTATQVATTINIPFDSKYLHNTALKYNPRDQRLYAYNNGHALVYELLFQTEE